MLKYLLGNGDVDEAWGETSSRSLRLNTTHPHLQGEEEGEELQHAYRGLRMAQTPRESIRTNIDDGEPLHIVVELASLATMTVVNRTIMKTLDTYVEKKMLKREESLDRLYGPNAHMRGGIEAHRRTISRTSILENNNGGSNNSSNKLSSSPDYEDNSFLQRAQQRTLDFLGYKNTEPEDHPENQTIQSDESSIHLPVHAAGFVFSSDIFDYILCQSFFSPEILRFIETLLHTSSLNHDEAEEDDDEHKQDEEREEEDEEGGEDEEGEEKTRSKHAKKLASLLSPELKGEPTSSLISIPVPPDFVGKKFIHFFNHLTHRFNAVCIALYRRNEESLPYVYTAPDSMTVLKESDYAMVLTCYQADVFANMPFEMDIEIKDEAVKNKLARPHAMKEGFHLDGVDAFKFKIFT
jgi:hypothetical protein